MRKHINIILVFHLCLTAGSLMAQEVLPGDPSRVHYEKALRELLRNNPEAARSELNQALPAGGPYSDLSRLALLRLGAQSKADGVQIVAGIKDQLLKFEDQSRIPAGWFAAVQALEEFGHDEIALDQAHELALRFPTDPLADNALYLAARILYRQRDYTAALDLIQQILAQKDRADYRVAALILQAQIYSGPGLYHSPTRACIVLLHARQLAQNLSTELDQVHRLERLYCTPY